jgi:MFS family permease
LTLSLARWPAFRHRNFRLFFVGQLGSLVGTWMQQAAQWWLVYRLTGSESLLGLIGFATQGPIVLLGALGGMVSDTFDRRRVLLITQSLSMLLAFTLAALTLQVPVFHWEPHVQVWHVLTVALMLGIVNAFDVPTRQAFLTDMVGKQDLISAVALNSSMFHAARIVGPAVGGAVIAAVGEGWCFFINGLSFLAVLASLTAIRLAVVRTADTRRRLIDGVKFVYGHAAVRSLLLLLALTGLTAGPYSVLLTAFARKVLHLDARGLGLLLASAGVGSLSGALRLSMRARAEGLRRTAAVSAAVAGVGLLALSASHVVWLAMIALVLVGFGITTQLASTNTLVQTSVPDAMRGRVIAVYAVMFMGIAPFGALMAGAIAERVGVSWTMGGGGALCLLGALVFTALGWEALKKDSVDSAIPAEAPARPR